MDKPRAFGRFFFAVSIAASALLSAAAQAQTQNVYLDFDTWTAGGDHVYSSAERIQILDYLDDVYGDFDFSFTDTTPISGDFSTLFFNRGPNGGVAEQVDFRNLDRNDTAQINVNTFFTSGTSEFVIGSANVAAHELGHLVGLRHGDSFGPIGSGLSPSFDGSAPYSPAYPGPTDAHETDDHILASPASVGSSLSDFETPSFFSERSAVKLSFNERGVVIGETAGSKDTFGTAQSITFEELLVPNTTQIGLYAGLDFDVDALTVTGSISAPGETDFYAFSGEENDLFNFEVISSILDYRIADVIDPVIGLFDSLGNFVDYYGTPAFNDQELETNDSILLDIFLPATGTYYIGIQAFDGADIGDYELFGYRFATSVPTPPALVMLLAGLLTLAYQRSQRR